MGDSQKQSEYPERVWKEVYHDQLSDLEEDRLPQTFPIGLVIERIPRYSRWVDVMCLGCGAVICFLLAWFLTGHYLQCGFWSGCFLNLGMGLVAGLILAWFAERRSRILCGYDAIAKTMRRRLETLSCVQNGCFADPHFILFNVGNRELACDWLYVHQSFIQTIESHFAYWEKILDGKLILDFGKAASRIESKLNEMGRIVRLDTSKLSQEDLRVLCGEVWRLEMGALKSYEKRIELLEAKVLDVRFGARPQSRWERLCRNCKGGQVNEQIRLDMAMEDAK